ncbi:hypothetical protein L596_001786 [Steinernema carpocapsae]|uniref:Uncharacterized protein n=1 Tax=Steinernema carpocapsae TaxID=34508 RepID=A0A4U8UML4_STECR|nr:hypothetical protein L596_001786 [Steinernema carpocapsae]
MQAFWTFMDRRNLVSPTLRRIAPFVEQMTTHQALCKQQERITAVRRRRLSSKTTRTTRRRAIFSFVLLTNKRFSNVVLCITAWPS